MNWGYIILGYLSLFALGISDNSRGPLFAEILKRFSVSDTQGASFFVLSSFLGFIGSYSVRFLLPKLNRIRTLQLSLAFMTIGLIGMGVATTFDEMVLFSAVLGFSIGVVGVVQNVLVTVGTTPQKRQRMLSGLHAVYGISSLLAPLVVAGVSLLTNSWQSVFWVLSLVPASLFVAAFFGKKEEPFVAVAATSESSRNIRGTQGSVAQIYLGFALGFYVLTETMISTRLSLVVRRELNLDLSQSSFYLTWFFVCMLAGRVLFAVVHFRWPLRWMLSWALALAAVSIALGILVNPLFLALSGLFMAPFYPLAVAYVYQQFEDRIDSAVSTCMAIQAMLTVVMHAGVGYLTDLYGISQALWIGPISLLLAFLMLNSFESIFRKRV